MGFWDQLKDKDINEAKSTEGGLYFSPGNYIAQIQRCKMIVTRDKKNAFIAEFKIISTDVDDPNLKPGSEPAYYVDMDGKYPELSLGNVADFVRAGLASLAVQHGEEHPPIAQIELTKKVANSVTGADNILAGVYLDINAYHKTGKTFTHFKWRVPTAEKLAELVAAAEAEAA